MSEPRLITSEEFAIALFIAAALAGVLWTLRSGPTIQTFEDGSQSIVLSDRAFVRPTDGTQIIPAPRPR